MSVIGINSIQKNQKFKRPSFVSRETRTYIYTRTTLTSCGSESRTVQPK